MYCMHAQKGALEAPRTCFRACKTSKFSGGVPPDPPCTIYLLVFALGPFHPLGGPAITIGVGSEVELYRSCCQPIFSRAYIILVTQVSV